MGGWNSPFLSSSGRVYILGINAKKPPTCIFLANILATFNQVLHDKRTYWFRFFQRKNNFFCTRQTDGTKGGWNSTFLCSSGRVYILGIKAKKPPTCIFLANILATFNQVLHDKRTYWFRFFQRKNNFLCTRQTDGTKGGWNSPFLCSSGMVYILGIKAKKPPTCIFLANILATFNQVLHDKRTYWFRFFQRKNNFFVLGKPMGQREGEIQPFSAAVEGCIF